MEEGQGGYEESLYEKGINKVNSEMLQKVANSLDVSIDFFFVPLCLPE
jgi:transcriptional regulator with XRE-family HTH domain